MEITIPEIPSDWAGYVEEGTLENIAKGAGKLRKKYEMETLPRDENLFRALELTRLADVKVVIFGQDPYYDYVKYEGKTVPKASGMSFSVFTGLPVPPSLRNIYEELKADSLENPDQFGNKKFKPPKHGNLTWWAVQGVLLLNAVPMIFPDENFKGDKNPFKSIWMPFTLQILSAIKKTNKKCIYVLWGASAQKLLGDKIKTKKFLLTGTHPSPLSASRGFFGCRHFSKINKLLEDSGQKPIDWHLE